MIESSQRFQIWISKLMKVSNLNCVYEFAGVLFVDITYLKPKIQWLLVVEVQGFAIDSKHFGELLTRACY